MVKSAPVREVEREAPVQIEAPWWLAENGLRVLQQRYFQKNIDGEFIEDLNGILTRVCENQAHIDGLWGIFKHHAGALRNTRPDQLSDENIALLKTLEGQAEFGWSEAGLQCYEKARYDAYMRYRQEMDEGLYLPATPILLNSGARTGMLYSCFVIPMDDTLMRKPGDPEGTCGIFDCVRAVVAVQKSGGGTGVSVSRTRPRGGQIFGGEINREAGVVIGHSTGSVNWLEEISDAVKHIEQGSARHGANMGILRIDHPDIIEFIMVKDGTRLRNFNISVAMTDVFLESLERIPDALWMCMNPHTKKKEMCYDKLGTAKDPSHPWTVQEVWDLIITRAWETGDPGLWFIDRVNKSNPTPNLGDFEACNPCVTADTWVMTEDGPRQVEDMLHESVKVVVSGETFPADTGFFETGVRPVFELRTKEGYRVKLTEDHKVMRVLRKGRMVWGATEWVEAKHLQPGDKIALHDHRDRSGWPGSGPVRHGYLLGYLLGDGTIKEAGVVLSVWGFDDEADSLCTALEDAARTIPKHSDAGRFGAPIEERNERRMQLMGLKEIAASYGMEPGSKLPDERLEETGSAFHAAFLKGLFDADGSVQGNREKGVSIRLSQSDSATLEMCQRMLLRIGIASTIYRDRRPAQSRPLPDGRGGTKNYDCKAQHELVISGVNMRFFRDRVGFEHAGKQMKLEGALEGYRRSLNIERFVATFEEFADLQTEERVYDIQVPGIHAFDGNGLMLHNCGEQELLPNESCNLGSIVVSRFIDSGPPKHGKYQIDWTKMERTVRTAIRHHDAVIDSNVYTVEVPAIRRATKATRKIGLGVMGWWDLLVSLGIPYESNEAVQLAEKIMGFINRIALEESQALARERGVFPAYEGSAEQVRGLCTRNATRSTIAPTGTISILVNITGGIEPTFGLAYIRDTPGTGGKVEEINATFQAWLDKQVEAKRFTVEEAREILESAFRGESVSESPLLRPEEKRLFRTANEIGIEWHVRHQAAFQKHTDNSVSKTINAPRDAARADIERAYNMAIERDLHGITVFRDGCLDESGQTQPMSYKKAEKAAEPATEPAIGKSFASLAPKPAAIRPLRPQIGISMKSLVGNVHLHITVDPKWDRELEVFGCVGKAGQLKLAQMEGMGRLISQILRLGGTMELVISQLKGIGSNHSTLSSGGRHRSLEDTVGHMLAKYLEAKQRWGMRALLLGEIEDDELRTFISAPLEAKQQEMDAFWGSGNGGGKTKGTQQHHGLVCGKCSSPIFLVGNCAVCLGCGDSQC